MVESIQVLAQGVHPIVPVGHTIWVQNGHNQEVKLAQNLHGLDVLTRDEIYDTFQGVTRSNFSRMHTRGDEDERLVDLVEVLFILFKWKEMFMVLLRRASADFTAGNSQQMDLSSLRRQNKRLLVEINVLSRGQSSLQLFQVEIILLHRPRITKCDIDLPALRYF